MIERTVCGRVINADVNHLAILGATLLYPFAGETGKPAFSVKQAGTDKLEDVAHIAGFAGVCRRNHVHCFGSKGFDLLCRRDWEEVQEIH